MHRSAKRNSAGLCPEMNVRTTGVALALAAAAVTGVALVASQPPSPAAAPADLVLRNGRIVTVDDSLPEAQALAARGDTIIAVGSDAEIAPYIGPRTQVMDLTGRLALPGFIEGHAHFMGIGEAHINLNFTSAKSWDEIVAMVATAARTAKAGDWIVGRGWHQEKWSAVPTPSVEGFPLHETLSRVSPDNPVLLAHASGHASFGALGVIASMQGSGAPRRVPTPGSL
jgi:predicted amidohydrolase YtcJ